MNRSQLDLLDPAKVPAVAGVEAAKKVTLVLSSYMSVA